MFRATSGAMPRSKNEGPLEGVTILVVEDHPASRRLLETLLNGAGAQVESVGTVVDALGALSRSVPRVVVADVVLPDADGLALVRALKSDPRTRDVVCIAITVLNGGDVEVAAQAAGCVACIHKPIDTESFAALVASHIGGN